MRQPDVARREGFNLAGNTVRRIAYDATGDTEHPRPIVWRQQYVKPVLAEQRQADRRAFCRWALDALGERKQPEQNEQNAQTTQEDEDTPKTQVKKEGKKRQKAIFVQVDETWIECGGAPRKKPMHSRQQGEEHRYNDITQDWPKTMAYMFWAATCESEEGGEFSYYVWTEETDDEVKLY